MNLIYLYSIRVRVCGAGRLDGHSVHVVAKLIVSSVVKSRQTFKLATSQLNEQSLFV